MHLLQYPALELASLAIGSDRLLPPFLSDQQDLPAPVRRRRSRSRRPGSAFLESVRAECNFLPFPQIPSGKLAAGTRRTPGFAPAHRRHGILVLCPVQAQSWPPKHLYKHERPPVGRDGVDPPLFDLSIYANFSVIKQSRSRAFVEPTQPFNLGAKYDVSAMRTAASPNETCPQLRRRRTVPFLRI